MRRLRPPQMYQHTDDLKRSFVFGKNQFIAALTTNTIESGLFTRSVMRQSDPDYLILGNFNNYNLAQLTQTKPELILNSNDLFCKDKLANYMMQTQDDPSHYGIFDETERLFFEIDHRYRQIWTDDYMTGGLNALDFDQTKVLYGLPSSIITVEDLMLRFQLRQLEDLYAQALSELKHEYKDEILFNPRILDTWITQITAEKFKNVLYSKSILFTASVFRNCAMLGKSNLLLCNKHFSGEIRHFIQKSNINADNIYRGYLKDQNHQDRERYQKLMKQSTRQEILKKFYLACKLVDNSPMRLMKLGHNVLRQSIFSKKLSRTSTKSILDEIMNRSKKYNQMYLDIQTDLISNNLTYAAPQLSKILLLSEQLTVQEERKIDYPVQYEVNSLEADQQQMMEIQKLQDMMLDYLKSERRLADYKLILQFKKKQYTKQNITLYTKVLGELKIKTGSKVKLPLHHFKQFSGYFKEVMRDVILQKEYGIKKIAPSQEHYQQVQSKNENNISIEQIQKLMANRNLSSEGSTQETMVQNQNNNENWEQVSMKKIQK